MRVTERMGDMLTQRELSNRSYDLLIKQRQATTGLRVEKASDDPIAAHAAIDVSRQSDANEQYQSNISRALGNLDQAEDALFNATDLMIEAHTLATQLANGTYSDSERSDAITRIEAIHDQLVSVANTEGLDGFIFAGYQSDQAAFNDAGIYQGDQGEIEIEVSKDLALRAGLNGEEIFSPASGQDVFAALDALTTALAADDGDAIAASAELISTARDQIVSAHATIGDQMAQFITQSEKLSDQLLNLTEKQANLVEVDSVNALTELAQAQQALTSAIKVSSATINSLTLVGQI